MAVRIFQVEEPFSPDGVLWLLWIEPFGLQVMPEFVQIFDVENYTSPIRMGLSLFEVEDYVFDCARAE